MAHVGCLHNCLPCSKIVGEYCAFVPCFMFLLAAMRWTVLLCLITGLLAWNHDRCDDVNGPTSPAWPGECQTGRENSPINVCGATPFPETAPSFKVTGYNIPRAMNIVNNGHTVAVHISDNKPPTLQLGALSAIVGRTTNRTTHTWHLEHIHFHWARSHTTTEGSEHYLQGKAYPMEGHFVHYNSAYGRSAGEAAATGKGDALLVVGVFFEIGEDEATALTTMAENIRRASPVPRKMDATVTLSTIFDGTTPLDYYSYRGGLTTPGCNELVTWVVLEKPQTMTMETLNLFRRASDQEGGVIGDYGNFRPLQPKNNRPVYSTSGNIRACGPVVEEHCNSKTPVPVRHAHYSYDECDTGDYSTSAWGGQCQVNSGYQTPIDICGAEPFIGAAPTFNLKNWALSRDLIIKNVGHSIQVRIKDRHPITQLGDISKLVGWTNNGSTHTWVLEQLHFHWARTGRTDEGSEHYLHGKAYPMEGHFVHYNSAYGNSVAEAASKGHKDALLVVGIFFDIGETEAEALTTIASEAVGAKFDGYDMKSPVDLSTIFDGTGSYYSYAGGLTTPGCNEFVTWVVMETPQTMTWDTMYKFYNVTTNPFSFKADADAVVPTNEVISRWGNYRPLQARNGRTVLTSSGNSSACTKVYGPDTQCYLPVYGTYEPASLTAIGADFNPNAIASTAVYGPYGPYAIHFVDVSKNSTLNVLMPVCSPLQSGASPSGTQEHPGCGWGAFVVMEGIPFAHEQGLHSWNTRFFVFALLHINVCFCVVGEYLVRGERLVVVSSVHFRVLVQCFAMLSMQPAMRYAQGTCARSEFHGQFKYCQPPPPFHSAGVGVPEPERHAPRSAMHATSLQGARVQPKPKPKPKPPPRHHLGRRARQHPSLPPNSGTDKNSG